MIKNVKINNFKSLVNFEADFSNAKNIIVIYGENGSGKTNFLSAINAVSKQVNSLENINFAMENFKDMFDDKRSPYSWKTVLKAFQSDTSLDGLLFKQITKGEPDGFIELDLIINNHKAKYTLVYNENRLIEEELHYLINKNVSRMYHFKYDATADDNIDYYISPQLFNSNDVINEVKLQINQHWGLHSFLSIMSYFISSRNKSFWEGKINNNLIEVIKYFHNFFNKNLPEESRGLQRVASSKELGLPHLGFDSIENTEKNIKLLDKASNIIYEFLSPLFMDLVDVEYTKEINKEKNELIYELQIVKDIGGKIRKISYNNESSGTKNLIQLFPYLLSFLDGNIVLVDEIENAIHDLLIKEILISLIEKSDDFKGQMIITTHNTLIMEQSNEEYIFILNEDNEGKTIEPISNYSNTRSRDNHNLRKRYLEGLYQGIPYIRGIEFNEIKQGIKNEET